MSAGGEGGQQAAHRSCLPAQHPFDVSAQALEMISCRGEVRWTHLPRMLAEWSERQLES
jgi:hypothetical protein